MSIVIDRYKEVDVGFTYSMVKLSPNGRFIAVTPNAGTSTSDVRIYDTQTQTLLSISCPSYIPTQAVAFSPNGNKLYVGSANTGTILVFQYTTSWAYVSNIVSSDNTASIHSIAVGADNVDIAWVEGQNIFKFYNTTTSTYYTGGGQLVSVSPTIPFIYADSAKKAQETNYFVFARPATVTGTTLYVLKQNNAYIVLQTQTNVNLSNVSLSPNGTTNYVSYNPSSAATSATKYYNNDIINSVTYLSVSQNNVTGGTVVGQINDELSLRYARGNPGTMSVGLIASYNVVDGVDYTITTPFTISGDIQISNRVIVNYNMNNGTKFEYASIINSDGNSTITVRPSTSFAITNRYYNATNYVVSENGKKFLYTNNNNTLQAGDVIAGIPINNVNGNPAGSSSNITPNNAAISPNGRYFFITDGTNLYHYVNSLNTSRAIRLASYTTGNAASRQMAISPDSKLLAYPDATSLKVYSISETGLTALTIPANNQVFAIAWFSPTEFYAMTSSDVIFYRVSGTSVSSVGTRNIGSNLFSIAISPDKKKLAFTTFGTGTAGLPYFFNIDQSNFTTLGTAVRGSNPAGGFVSNNYYGSFSPDGNKFALSGRNASSTNNLIVFNTTNISAGNVTVLGNGTYAYGFVKGPQWTNNSVFKTVVDSNTLSFHDFSILNGALTEVTNFNTDLAVITSSVGNNTWGVKVSPDGRYIIRPTQTTTNDAIYNLGTDDGFTNALPFKNTVTTSSIISSDSKYIMLPGAPAAGNGIVDFYEKTSADVPVLRQQFTGLPWVAPTATVITTGDYSSASKLFVVPYGRSLLMFRNNEDGTFTDLSKHDLTVSRTGAKFSNDGSRLYLFTGNVASSGIDIYDRSGSDYVYRTTFFSTYSVSKLEFSSNGQYALISYNGAPYLSVNSVASDGTFNTVIATVTTQTATSGAWLTDSMIFATTSSSAYGYHYIIDFYADKGVMVPRPFNGATIPGGYKQQISVSDTGNKKTVVLGHPSELGSGTTTTSGGTNNFLSLYSFKFEDTANNISGNTLIPSITTSGNADAQLGINSDIVLKSIVSEGFVDNPVALTGGCFLNDIVTTGFLGDDSSKGKTSLKLTTAFVELSGKNFAITTSPLPQPYVYGVTTINRIQTTGFAAVDTSIDSDLEMPSISNDGTLTLPPQFEGNTFIPSLETEGFVRPYDYTVAEIELPSLTSEGLLSQGETMDIGIILSDIETAIDVELNPEIDTNTVLPAIETNGELDVEQHAFGDTQIESISNETIVSSGEEATLEITLSNILGDGYVTTGENFDGDTLLPIIITAAEVNFGPYLTGDTLIDTLVTDANATVYYQGQINSNTSIPAIITEGLMSPEGLVSGDTVIDLISTEGEISRQADIDATIYLNDIVTNISANLVVEVSGDSRIHLIMSESFAKILKNRRRFLNII